MARALIVGCGCRGRALGSALADRGWQVRGTSRRPEGAAAIEAAGIEPAIADPARIGTLVDHLEGVTLVFWLLGWAAGPGEEVAALHSERLARLLEEIVDTPVRGFVYELGEMSTEVTAGAFELLRDAGVRWRIPCEVVAADPEDVPRWRGAMLAAALALTGG